MTKDQFQTTDPALFAGNEPEVHRAFGSERATTDSSSNLPKGATAGILGSVAALASAVAPFIASSTLRQKTADGAAKVAGKAASGTAKAVDTSVESAAPAAQTGVDAVSGANDKMHEMVESMLGAISTKLDNLPEKKDAVLASTPLLKDTAAGKKATAKKNKGYGLITLGLVTLAGAGAAYYMAQQKKNDDPWAVADEDLEAASLTPTAPGGETQVTTTVTPAGMYDDGAGQLGTEDGARIVGADAAGDVSAELRDDTVVDKAGPGYGTSYNQTPETPRH